MTTHVPTLATPGDQGSLPYAYITYIIMIYDTGNNEMSELT